MSVQNIAETHTLTKDNRPQFQKSEMKARWRGLYVSEYCAALSFLVYQEFWWVFFFARSCQMKVIQTTVKLLNRWLLNGKNYFIKHILPFVKMVLATIFKCICVLNTLILYGHIRQYSSVLLPI